LFISCFYIDKLFYINYLHRWWSEKANPPTRLVRGHELKLKSLFVARIKWIDFSKGIGKAANNLGAFNSV